MARFLTGTIAQLAGKLTINGVTLNAPELSLLTRILSAKGGQVKQVGIIRKEGERGRPAIIWQVDTETAMWCECADTSELVESDDDAPEYVKPAAKAVAA